MATRDITLSDLGIGSVEELRVSIFKDGTPWDLSQGSVTIVLKRPDKTIAVNEEMTAEDGINGIFFYRTLVTDLDVIGYWTASIVVEDTSTFPVVTKEYPYAIGFYVADQ